MDFLKDSSHTRYNPLTGEWVLVSPHRLKSPWQGQVETLDSEKIPEYDPTCYLCPGNTRSNGTKNPVYTGPWAFTNDFPSILFDIPPQSYNKKDLLIAKTENGICRVICFSPRHDLTLPLLPVEDIEKIIRTWVSEYVDLGKKEPINYVQIFENRGAMMGCSNPHPHMQIYSEESIPVIPALECEKQKEYTAKNGSCLLCDYLAVELAEKERIIYQNDSFAVLVPFWAVWPFEVMILPKRHMNSIDCMKDSEVHDLADAMKRIGIKYDNLFSTSFPYSMGIHQKPTDGKPYDEWHFHFHYSPPLLRSATVKKFMVGYELLAMAQRDLTAEVSAEMIRRAADVHYLAGKK